VSLSEQPLFWYAVEDLKSFIKVTTQSPGSPMYMPQPASTKLSRQCPDHLMQCLGANSNLWKVLRFVAKQQH